MNQSSIHGSCLCGTVTFEVNPPFQKMAHCHCSRCRKSTGTGHATNLTVDPSQFRWLSGEDIITRYDLPTAQRFGKWFCNRCGCPIPRLTRDGKIITIPAGSLDTVPPITPTDHIFWASRVPWGCASGGLPTHAEYPESWSSQNVPNIMELETVNLRLVLQSTEAILAQIEAMSPADQAEVSSERLTQLQSAPFANPWTHGFAIVLKTSGAVIGSCGYKGPPSSDGSVEIAYIVDADQQGRGYATEAAAALTRYALDSSQVRLVCAHTRPEENASTHVLTKCGFRWVGEVNDPEDGLVWRWERTIGHGDQRG